MGRWRVDGDPIARESGRAAIVRGLDARSRQDGVWAGRIPPVVAMTTIAEDFHHLHTHSRFEEAFELLLGAMRQPGLPPEVQDVYLYNLGQLAAGLGRWSEMEWAFAQLRKLSPNNLGYGHRWAFAAEMVGDIAGAIDYRARLSPRLAGAGLHDLLADNLFQHARLLVRLDMPEDATDLLEQALEAVPGHGRADLLLRLLNPGPITGPVVVQTLAEPARVRDLSAATVWERPPEWFARDYYAATVALHPESDSRIDLGFIVVGRDGRPLLRAELYAIEGGLQGPIGPVQLLWAEGAEAPGEKAMAVALAHIQDLCRVFDGVPLIAEYPGTGPSALGRLLFKKGYRARVQVWMDIDLTQSEEEIWRGIRSSNRPYIRRGEAELEVRYANADHPDATLVDQARALNHIYDPDSSGDIVFFSIPLWRRWIAEGRAEMAVYYDGDAAVAAVLITDEGDTAVYTYSRYCRDTRIRVGPFALWNAIRRAKARGRTRFHVGIADFGEYGSAKLRNIVDFKSGFTEDYRYAVSWWSPRDSDGGEGQP